MAGYSIRIDASVFGADRVKALNKDLAAVGKQAQQLPKQFTAAGREIKTASNGLKYFTDAAGRARSINGQFLTSTQKAAAGIRNVGNAAQKASGQVDQFGRKSQTASGGVGKLAGTLKGLAASYALIQATKFVLVKTAELETQTRSLQVLTGSLEDAKKVISDLQDFGALTPFTSSELIDTAKRLRAFGVDTKDLTDTVKRLGDVAGATGADLGGIATAFGQIIAKGRLQGEELLQLQERGVNLQDELQKMYGLTADEFRKALEKGRISAEAVELALRNVTSAGGKYADGAIAQSDTLAGKFSTLQDNVTRFAQAK